MSNPTLATASSSAPAPAGTRRSQRRKNRKKRHPKTSSDATAIASPLLEYGEASDYLRIHVATLDRMVRAAEIPSVVIRGRRLFHRADLDEYIAAQRIGGR